MIARPRGRARAVIFDSLTCLAHIEHVSKLPALGGTGDYSRSSDCTILPVGQPSALSWVRTAAAGPSVFARAPRI